jgi:hypothetical protein
MTDDRKYVSLRDGIALRLHLLPGEEQAEALFGDAQRRVWQDSRAYKAKSQNRLYDADMGALRLLADAFASLPEADTILVARHPETFGNKYAEPWPRMVWLEFMKRCVARDAAFMNRMRELSLRSGDTELSQEINRLLTRQDLPANEIPHAFDKYVRGEVDSRDTFNALRFDRSGQVAAMVNETLRESVSVEECERVITLLEGFESRWRNSVVRCVLDNWALLKSHSLERACGVLTQADIRDKATRTRAVHLLDEEFRASKNGIYRSTMDQILEGS